MRLTKIEAFEAIAVILGTERRVRYQDGVLMIEARPEEAGTFVDVLERVRPKQAEGATAPTADVAPPAPEAGQPAEPGVTEPVKEAAPEKSAKQRTVRAQERPKPVGKATPSTPVENKSEAKVEAAEATEPPPTDPAPDAGEAEPEPEAATDSSEFPPLPDEVRLSARLGDVILHLHDRGFKTQAELVRACTHYRPVSAVLQRIAPDAFEERIKRSASVVLPAASDSAQN